MSRSVAAESRREEDTARRDAAAGNRRLLVRSAAAAQTRSAASPAREGIVQFTCPIGFSELLLNQLPSVRSAGGYPRLRVFGGGWGAGVRKQGSERLCLFDSPSGPRGNSRSHHMRTLQLIIQQDDGPAFCQE